MCRKIKLKSYIHASIQASVMLYGTTQTCRCAQYPGVTLFFLPMPQHPHITGLIIILVNPVALAGTWHPDLLRFPVTALDIIGRRIVNRSSSIISRAIAITAVGSAVPIRIAKPSQIYPDCPAVITTTVATIVTSPTTMAAVISATSISTAAMVATTAAPATGINSCSQ